MTEACHTVYERECEVSYRPQMTKVKVKVCPDEESHEVEEDEQDTDESNSVVIDVRPAPRTLKETR